MKLHLFVCSLGFLLSLVGAADCASRHKRFAEIIELYEMMGANPPEIARTYEEVMSGHPRAEFAAKIYRGQEKNIEALRQGTIDMLRGVQDTQRNLGILFVVLAVLFGVTYVHLGRSNKALQGDVPRPAGSARA